MPNVMTNTLEKRHAAIACLLAVYAVYADNKALVCAVYAISSLDLKDPRRHNTQDTLLLLFIMLFMFIKRSPRQRSTP